MTIIASYKRAYVRNLSASFSAAALSSHDNSLKPIDMKLAHHQHESYVNVISQLVPQVDTVVSVSKMEDYDTAVYDQKRMPKEGEVVVFLMT